MFTRFLLPASQAGFMACETPFVYAGPEGTGLQSRDSVKGGFASTLLIVRHKNTKSKQAASGKRKEKSKGTIDKFTPSKGDFNHLISYSFAVLAAHLLQVRIAQADPIAALPIPTLSDSS